MNVIKNFTFFYISPKKEVLRKYSIFERLKNTGLLLIFNWCLVIFAGVIINIFLIELGIMNDPIAKEKLFLLPLKTTLLFAGFIAPVVEELISRIWLIYSRFNLSIASAATIATIIYKFFLKTVPIDSVSNRSNILISIGIGIIAFFAIKLILQVTKLNFSVFIKSHIRPLAIVSGIVFGYLHLFNYKITLNLLMFSPIILANYIFGGLILGFIRVRYGFIYGILFHVLYNSIFILIKYR